MDWPLVLLSQLDGLVTSTGLQNGVAPRSEALASHCPQRFFVFQYQNGFCAFRILTSPFQSVNQGRRRFVNARQIDVESGTRPQCAGNPDIAATLLNDSVDRCQSQSSAMALWFRGEERLKSAGSYLCAHSLTCVTYREANVTSRSNVGMAGHIVRP